MSVPDSESDPGKPNILRQSLECLRSKVEPEPSLLMCDPGSA